MGKSSFILTHKVAILKGTSVWGSGGSRIFEQSANQGEGDKEEKI